MIARIQGKAILKRPPLYKGVFFRGLEMKLAAWATIDDYDSVLDMYCDNEQLLSIICSKYRIRACGICSSNEQAEDIRNRLYDAEIIYGTGDNIPWHNDTFDVAICSQLPDNITNINATIKDALRVLRPGGQFIAACPLRSMGMSRLNNWKKSSHEHQMDAHQLLMMMENAGYRESSMRISGVNHGIVIGWKAAV